MYLLVKADVGDYSLSYRGYDAWQSDYWRMSVDEGRALREHVWLQVFTAVNDPGSEIGHTVRIIEQACDSLQPGLGTLVWWDHILGPMHLRFSTGRSQRAAAEGEFIQAIYDYQGAQTSNPDLASFGDFMAATGYLDSFESWMNPKETPSPTPSPRPSPTRATEAVLNEGTILYDRPLSEWRSEQLPNGWIQATSTSLHIGVFAAEQEEVVETWTDRQDFGDISASVEVREVSNRAAAVGCLSVRHTSASGDYSFCIRGDGQTWVGHYFVDANGTFQEQTLLDVASRPGTVSGWNTLTIIAIGNQLTFLVNDTAHGTVTHNARTTGGALAVVSQDADQDAEFEFRNLVVREAR
jgi:hypothetical protein